MKRLVSWGGLALIAALAGCAYYNAMWSAEQYAKGARKLEAQGQQSQARSQWAQAAAKAEAVVIKHPKSRWVDDALVLQAEGLARSGSCDEAEDAIERARERTKDVALRERVDLADAECAVAAGRTVQADAALVEVLKSKDAARRSRAQYVAGVSAALRLDYGGAVEHLRRSHEPAARPARARALLELGQGRAAEAAAVIDTIGGDPVFETERADLLAGLAEVGGPEMASASLDRLLTHARLPFAEQARLLIADGDRRAAQGDYPAATARYHRAIEVAGLTSSEAATAHVRAQRLNAVQATQRSELTPVIAELTELSRAGNGEAKHLLDLLGQAAAAPPGAGARFRIAELVRDSLGAPALAGQLFLEAAAADTASLYAPKALVAALPLLPDRHDSITAVLDTRYATSPYTRAYHGEASVAYVAAEDSLARELGVEVARAGGGGATTAASGLRSAIPVPGMRGPQLDEPAAQPAGAPPVRPPTTPRPGARPAAGNPNRDRPNAPDRP